MARMIREADLSTSYFCDALAYVLYLFLISR